jgi:hypothetical protein
MMRKIRGMGTTLQPARTLRSPEFQPQNESVSKLLAENERRGERLQRYTVIRTYEIKSREGKMVAVGVVRMEYCAPDVKKFERTSEKGSGLVRRLVFDQLMDSENEFSSAKQREDSALTPVNHVFHFCGEGGCRTLSLCLVLQVMPRRVDKYLLQGRIWIESHDFAVATATTG